MRVFFQSNKQIKHANGLFFWSNPIYCKWQKNTMRNLPFFWLSKRNIWIYAAQKWVYCRTVFCNLIFPDMHPQATMSYLKTWQHSFLSALSRKVPPSSKRDSTEWHFLNFKSWEKQKREVLLQKLEEQTLRVDYWRGEQNMEKYTWQKEPSQLGLMKLIKDMHFHTQDSGWLVYIF